MLLSLGFLRPVFHAFGGDDKPALTCSWLRVWLRTIALSPPLFSIPVPLNLSFWGQLFKCEPQICPFSNFILATLSYHIFCTFLIKNIVSSIQAVWVIIYIFLSEGVSLGSKIPTVFKEAPWWFLKLKHSITFRYKNQTRVCFVLR